MPAPRRSLRGPVGLLIAIAVLLLIGALLHIGLGTTDWFRTNTGEIKPLGPVAVFAELLRGQMADPTWQNQVVWQFRLPRAVSCILVGGSLGLVGSAFQAQLRNPLADPYIVGVSSGAAVGGVIALITGLDTRLGGMGTTALGFVTGMMSLALVYGLARRRGLIDVSALLLAGVVIGSLLSSILSLLLLMSGRDTNSLIRWLLGSMSETDWQRNLVLTITTVVGGSILVLQSKRLNAFAIGEDTAARLGVDVPRLRIVVLVVGTAMTAAAVGAVGIIGFLGLVAPHISRRLVGVDWRWSLPGAGLIGAMLLLFADIIAQRGIGAIAPNLRLEEAPVGIVTAILGAPSLLILLRKQG